MQLRWVTLVLLAGCAQSVGVKNENPDLSIDLAAFLGPPETSDGGLDFAIAQDLAGRDLAGSITDMNGCTHIDPVFGATIPTGWLETGNSAATTYNPSNEWFQLTTPGSHEAGTAFYTTPQNVTSFHVTFSAIIGGGNGSDGMAFVLASATTPRGFAPTSDGGGLGYYGMDAIAVEFDTSYNDDNGDPNGNHVAYMSSSSLYGSATHVPGLINTTLPKLSNGEIPHTVDISFTGTSVTCTVDSVQMFTGPLPAGYPFTPGMYYFGFTGSTGSGTDYHAVNNVHITTGGAGCN
jgi:hypothetical protein